MLWIGGGLLVVAQDTVSHSFLDQMQVKVTDTTLDTKDLTETQLRLQQA